MGRLDSDAQRARLSQWLCAAFGREVHVRSCERLSGGAIQENWGLAVGVDGESTDWVLRADASASVAASLSRGREFAALQAAAGAGVPVARPLVHCGDAEVIGSEFFVTTRLPGVALGPRLVKDDSVVPDRQRLAASLGRAMARLHRTPLPADWPAPPDEPPSLATIARLRSDLDVLTDDPQAAAAAPTLEWGLRKCERHRPAGEEVCFTHGDWRTGNYLVADGDLAGVLDWEFAGWGNPVADIGWLFARCWRFGRDDRRCGGVADDEAFLLAYEAEAGSAVAREQIEYWELIAHLRWAVIALQQAARHRSGSDRSIELALTGHLVPGLELEILHASERLQ